MENKNLLVPIWEFPVRVAYNAPCTFALPVGISKYLVTMRFPELRNVAAIHTAEILVFENGIEIEPVRLHGFTFTEYVTSQEFEVISLDQITNTLSFLRKRPEDIGGYRSEVYITKIEGLLSAPPVVLLRTGWQK